MNLWVDTESAIINRIIGNIIPIHDLPILETDDLSMDEAKNIADSELKETLETPFLNNQRIVDEKLIVKLTQKDEVRLIYAISFAHDRGQHKVEVDAKSREVVVINRAVNAVMVCEQLSNGPASTVSPS
jgi:hypothetical protein